MRDTWRDVRLGECFSLSNKKLGYEAADPPILSLSKYRGIVLAEEFFDKRIASESLSSYKVLEQDQWAYSTIHIDEGSIGRNTFGIRGVLSPMYTTMYWTNADHDPRFFELLLRSPSLLSEYRDHAQGTVNRRRSLPFKTFSTLSVPVPPLAEQRRIVDVIAAVDTASEAAEREHDRSRAMLEATLREWSASWNGSRARLGDLAEIGSGPSWSSKNESVEPAHGGTRVLGITNTPATGEVDMSDIKYVTGLPAGTRRLGPGSLLMIRTNGNRSRIGNVYRVPVEAEGAAFSAFQIGITLRETADAEFSFWMLAAPELQQQISHAASGTTGLGNVAVTWLRDLALPWPEADERVGISTLFSAVAEHTRRCMTLLTRLQQLRSALLGDLLSGDHAIPEAYDELLTA